jgi:hypothetical protein
MTALPIAHAAHVVESVLYAVPVLIVVAAIVAQRARAR